MKNWKNYDLKVNGLTIETVYNQATVETLFVPLLERLTRLQKEKGRRIIVFMAAPPAVGKTTAAMFLEYLSAITEHVTKIQSIGLDGFHYHSDYIAEHSIERNGILIPMRDVKGCPETFDINRLKEKLKALKVNDITWPVYSRRLHDVVEDAITVTGEIILLEGNWLLLDEDGWRDLKEYSDLTMMIRADKEFLRERLTGRKIKGGMDPDAAERFYETSDSINVDRVLSHSVQADITWELLPDNDYTEFKGERRMKT